MLSRIGATLAAVLALALAPDSSQAASAFAAGIPDSVSQDGVAMGWANNSATRAEAEAQAIERCKSSNSSEKAHGLCKVIAHFDGRCLATSIDPKAGTPGWGWAIANSRNSAIDQAVSMCRQSAGADRAPYCDPADDAVCDTAR